MAKKKPTKSKTKSDAPTPVTSIRHQDKRANIPTEELRDFVAADERAPKTMLYPRDPSLDPQLVWKGKDQQDAADLAVPIVPIYIQEKIHPQALIEDLRRQAAAHTPARPRDEQLSLFGDFNGLDHDFDKKVDFYRWEQHWTNRMILGDSLLVMTSLAEKEGLKGKVQTIYFDPPYGIKFGSNWQVSTRKRDVKDGKVEDLTRQPEQIRAFRDCWRIGIHSYLAYIRDILTAARELLTETGSMFVQIGDENVHLVQSVLDEVFGNANFCRLITFTKTSGQTDNLMSSVSDYVLWYAKQKVADGKLNVKVRALFLPASPGAVGALEYKRVEVTEGAIYPISRFKNEGKTVLPEGARIFATDSIVSAGGDDPDIDLEWEGKRFRLSCRPNRHWKPGVPGIKKLWGIGRLLRQESLRIYKRYFDDFPWRELVDNWTDTRGDDDSVYVVQTDTKVIQRCLLMTTDPGDLVLDPTCGSGTTAYVAEQWGRRWITIDTSRVALALARTRLMAAKYPYYHLADSPEGIDKEFELSGQRPPPHLAGNDIRKGFVYKRVPHVTLKSIANNPDIREGMTREQIDAAIARHAETERSTTSPTKITNAYVSAARSLSRACHPIASSPQMKTSTVPSPSRKAVNSRTSRP